MTELAYAAIGLFIVGGAVIFGVIGPVFLAYSYFAAALIKGGDAS